MHKFAELQLGLNEIAVVFEAPPSVAPSLSAKCKHWRIYPPFRPLNDKVECDSCRAN